MKSELMAGCAALVLSMSLSACGASGPSFADVEKDHSKADEACKGAFGEGQDKLGVFVPDLDQPDGATYKIEGSWDEDSSKLDCWIQGKNGGDDMDGTDVYFAHKDAATDASGVTSTQGDVTSWTSVSDSSGANEGKVRERLDEVTKNLAG